MGNMCCGGDDYEVKPGRVTGGGPPPAKVMTPDQDARREQARLAAEERARQGAVRGTQRYHPKKPPKNFDNANTASHYNGPDIATTVARKDEHYGVLCCADLRPMGVIGQDQLGREAQALHRDIIPLYTASRWGSLCRGGISSSLGTCCTGFIQQHTVVMVDNRRFAAKAN